MFNDSGVAYEFSPLLPFSFLIRKKVKNPKSLNPITSTQKAIVFASTVILKLTTTERLNIAALFIVDVS